MGHGVFVRSHKAVFKPRDINKAVTMRLNQCFLQQITRWRGGFYIVTQLHADSARQHF